MGCGSSQPAPDITPLPLPPGSPLGVGSPRAAAGSPRSPPRPGSAGAEPARPGDVIDVDFFEPESVLAAIRLCLDTWGPGTMHVHGLQLEVLADNGRGSRCRASNTTGQLPEHVIVNLPPMGVDADESAPSSIASKVLGDLGLGPKLYLRGHEKAPGCEIWECISNGDTIAGSDKASMGPSWLTEHHSKQLAVFLGTLHKQDGKFFKDFEQVGWEAIEAGGGPFLAPYIAKFGRPAESKFEWEQLTEAAQVALSGTRALQITCASMALYKSLSKAGGDGSRYTVKPPLSVGEKSNVQKLASVMIEYTRRLSGLLDTYSLMGRLVVGHGDAQPHHLAYKPSGAGVSIVAADYSAVCRLPAGLDLSRALSLFVLEPGRPYPDLEMRRSLARTYIEAFGGAEATEGKFARVAVDEVVLDLEAGVCLNLLHMAVAALMRGGLRSGWRDAWTYVGCAKRGHDALKEAHAGDAQAKEEILKGGVRAVCLKPPHPWESPLFHAPEGDEHRKAWFPEVDMYDGLAL